MCIMYTYGLSTISAHGRALKLSGVVLNEIGSGQLSTISAHGRALKQVHGTHWSEAMEDFQQFRLTVEH